VGGGIQLQSDISTSEVSFLFMGNTSNCWKVLFILCSNPLHPLLTDLALGINLCKPVPSSPGCPFRRSPGQPLFTGSVYRPGILVPLPARWTLTHPEGCWSQGLANPCCLPRDTSCLPVDADITMAGGYHPFPKEGELLERNSGSLRS
jgi:hypothetical protein